MRRNPGIISSVLFLISLVAYTSMLFGNEIFLFTGVIVSIIGKVFALFSKKGIYRKIGLIGNGLIVLVLIIVPLIVTTFFWNTP
ncbi:hypothetical protein [Halobacillus sp. B23F22_1]|uniref:hypothetical protein n=1 Tax=Halobacillus sp. B23F22_1 TaxID=3459514 RepID=UPI00373DFCF8